MLTINNNSLVAGYIKQLLKEFNLPKAKVLIKGMPIFSGAYYVDKNFLYKANKNATYGPEGDFNDVNNSEYLTKIDRYIYGKHYLNITKNLEMRTPLYDSYTHYYLGDYLRFYRDFKNIDLMSMYNCFAGDVAHNISYSFDEVVFDTNDNSSVIYLVPAKFFKEYTIAIDCTTSVEVSACFYNNNQVSLPQYSKILAETCYFKKVGAQFTKPFKFSGLTAALDTVVEKAEDLNKEALRTKLYGHEKDLYLLIKLPINHNSSLVVLEGDYVEAASQTYKSQTFNITEETPGLSTNMEWFKLNDAGDFEQVVSSNISYYEGGYLEGSPVDILIPYVTYYTKDGEVEINDEDTYYNFDDSGVQVNYSVQSSVGVHYYLSKDSFPETPKSTEKTHIFVDEETGLSYVWDDTSKEYVKIEDSVISLAPYFRKYNSRMQLLYLNDGNSYLFADKLIGYLLGNVITSDDNIVDNIRRLQKAFFYRKNPTRKPDYKPGIDVVKEVGYNVMPRHVGLWSQDLRNMTYELMYKTDVLNTSFDVIGFVDKDAEKVLGDDVSYDKTGHMISGGIR